MPQYTGKSQVRLHWKSHADARLGAETVRYGCIVSSLRRASSPASRHIEQYIPHVRLPLVAHEPSAKGAPDADAYASMSEVVRAAIRDRKLTRAILVVAAGRTRANLSDFARREAIERRRPRYSIEVLPRSPLTSSRHSKPGSPARPRTILALPRLRAASRL